MQVENVPQGTEGGELKHRSPQLTEDDEQQLFMETERRWHAEQSLLEEALCILERG
jgi:hypothetical protein